MNAAYVNQFQTRNLLLPEVTIADIELLHSVTLIDMFCLVFQIFPTVKKEKKKKVSFCE